jgi:hypothetical protein
VIFAAAGTGIGLGVSGAASAASYTAPSVRGPLQEPPGPGTPGPENVPIPYAPSLAGTSGQITGQAIDGIRCNTMEQTLFHIHTHLTIFVKGWPYQVPYGIGIPAAVAAQTPNGKFVQSGKCFYWLHTHAADGIIHIESPVQRNFTLGDFFDIWGQPLGPNQLGPARGQVAVYINQQYFRGNPRDAPLGSHEDLQVEIGPPWVDPEWTDWSNTGL